MLGCGVGEGANQVATLNCIFPLLTNIVYWAITFSGTVALIIIIISGIRLITSGGDAKTVETAKKSLALALAGLLIVFLSFLIINTIAYFTNVPCIAQTSKGLPAFPFQQCANP